MFDPLWTARRGGSRWRIGTARVPLPAGGAPPAAPLALTDRHRTVLLHVLEVRPGEYSWQLVLREHQGSADGDCIVQTQCCWPSHAQAQAAGWAEGNRLLQGCRVVMEP